MAIFKNRWFDRWALGGSLVFADGSAVFAHVLNTSVSTVQK
jgi:hypothetical protein